MLKFYLCQPLSHAAYQRHGFLRFGGIGKPCARRKSIFRLPQQGFTLLELLVVVAILGIIALAATTYIIDTGELRRQNETEKRWDAIRKAIIGEPNLTLNGSPYLSSYVADMGRLPSNIQELFIQGTQPDWTSINLYVADTANGFSSAFGGGWRGPYLYAAGSRFFRDGWNNQDFVARDDGGGIDDDATNFGWRFTTTGVTPDHTDIAIQSLGDINTLGGTGFMEDFPADNTLNMVQENEWRLSASPLTFSINFNRPVASGEEQTDLELRIYRYIDSNDAVADFANDIDEIAADATFAVAVGETATAVQTVTPDELPMGRYAAVIWCTAPTTVPDVVYDGNCDATNAHNPYYFTLLPGISQVTVRWNLP